MKEIGGGERDLIFRGRERTGIIIPIFFVIKINY